MRQEEINTKPPFTEGVLAMRKRIVEVVDEKNGSVTFAEFQNEIEGFEGSNQLYLDEESNIYIWFNVSDDFMIALLSLREEEVVDQRTTQPLIYMIDGCIPKYPVAKSQNRKYKQPHWLPVTSNKSKNWDKFVR